MRGCLAGRDGQRKPSTVSKQRNSPIAESVIAMNNNNALEQFFCKFSKAEVPYDIYPGRIAEYIIDELHYQKIVVIGNQVYLYKNGVFALDDDGKELKSEISYLIPKDLLEPSRIRRVYDLIVMNHSITRKFEEMNQYPVEMINFTNGMLDARTMQLTEHDPMYLSTNQIPFPYIEDTENGYSDSVASRFFKGLVPDDDDRRMLFRYFGICFTRDTTAQKFLVFSGVPGSGKSVALNYLSNCIGRTNISNVALADLNKRFYPSLLFGKLVNVCADLPRTALDAVDELKKITGEDDILCERKGVDAYPFKSYAKLIFSTNQLPPILDEKSNAFFRRLLIVRVQHIPPHIDNLQEGLTESIPGFIAQCMTELHRYYAEGKPALDSKNSQDAVAQYYRDADSVMAWLDDSGMLQGETMEKGQDLYSSYQTYCVKEDLVALSRKGLFLNLRGKGYQEKKLHGYTYFQGGQSGRLPCEIVTFSSPISSPTGEISSPRNEFIPYPEAENLFT